MVEKGEPGVDVCCPKCSSVQKGGLECVACGIIFSRIRKDDGSAETSLSHSERVPGLDEVIAASRYIRIIQKGVSLIEAISQFEVANKYEILDQTGRRGAAFEQTGDVLDQLVGSLFGSNRDLRIIIFDRADEPLLEITRPATFFSFTDIVIRDMRGELFGLIRRRWKGLSRRYELLDAAHREFAWIRRPFLRVWHFPVIDRFGNHGAMIAKKWSGLLRESWSDHDTFALEFGKTEWTLDQKAILLVAALAIDFDYFENNR